MPDRPKKSRISVRRSFAMHHDISAFADEINIREVGRAFFLPNADILAMAQDWRERLERARQEKKMSKRALSLAAGFNPGYYFAIMADERDPAMDNVVRLADVLGLSLPYLFYGVEIGPDEERLLRAFASLNDRQRRAILDLAGVHDDQPPSS